MCVINACVVLEDVYGDYVSSVVIDLYFEYVMQQETEYDMDIGFYALSGSHGHDMDSQFLQLFCNLCNLRDVDLDVDHGMNYVDVDNDVDIDNDIQNDDMVHVKCVLALSCQANVNTQKPSLKVRQYT
eukprot:TRINITY_DN37_c0_g2_i12.p2 TRINITY_DN37_c0_g2~~TRINITY_DN37_c0_g2_i12.p2  ORF type:complete len:128 (-),score=8.37 TRINITY_DN37_c0_g2_i12:23-406(-)